METTDYTIIIELGEEADDLSEIKTRVQEILHRIKEDHISCSVEYEECKRVTITLFNTDNNNEICSKINFSNNGKLTLVVMPDGDLKFYFIYNFNEKASSKTSMGSLIPMQRYNPNYDAPPLEHFILQRLCSQNSQNF